MASGWYILCLLPETKSRNKYVYGPVHSWRSGTSLGIDPIGDVSTCSFNCSYCQLGQIQKVTQEIKVYVPTQYVIDDLQEFAANKTFDFNKLDVITFAGSGEPTLAENLGEIITAIKDLQHSVYKTNVPISILTNATMFQNRAVRERALLADLISLKLDAPNDEILKSINQPAPGITIASIVEGIKLLKKDLNNKKERTKDCDHKIDLQLQIMFMPKFIKDQKYLEDLAKLILDIGIYKIQINTPTRPKPLSKDKKYFIETRGNHYANGEIIDKEYDLVELPVIDKEEAFAIEDKLHHLLRQSLPIDKSAEIDIVNVYKK